jgi:hypothetical protein
MNRVVRRADRASSRTTTATATCRRGREHGEHEEIEPRVDGLVERFEDARLVPVAALARQQVLRLVAAITTEVRVQQVHHRPQMPAFFHVDLEEIAQIVEARAAVTEPALLLDAGGLSIALRHDQPRELIAKLPGTSCQTG